MADERTRAVFAGDRLRTLRQNRGISQRGLAALLGLSPSYISQIESDDRPITAAVLDLLAWHFKSDWSLVDAEGEISLLVRAGMAVADQTIADPLSIEPAVQRTLSRSPGLARRLVAMHSALLAKQEQVLALDDRLNINRGDSARLPWEEVRDWFHHERNYIDEIDRAAEKVAASLKPGSPAQTITAHLREKFGVAVEESEPGETLRSFEQDARILRVDTSQAIETTAFSLAHQLARLEIPGVVDGIVCSRGISAAGRQLLDAGLVNYAAGAILMPYSRFRIAAQEARHDIDTLRRLFGSSFEQTCHRLSTLQRPGAEGVPFFFCRIDMASNITKRHSATRLQFAQFGGACPLWVVHEAVAIPDRILVQLAETPDGVRYVSMAKGLVKASRSYAHPPRRYAVALGCEAEYAADFIYADGLDLKGMATPIGTSCRICPRQACEQRAFPPAATPIHIEHDRRGVVPYKF